MPVTSFLQTGDFYQRMRIATKDLMTWSCADVKRLIPSAGPQQISWTVQSGLKRGQIRRVSRGVYRWRGVV